PATSPDLARLANDEMAAIVARHPYRFPGFVASLPMNNPDAARVELDRAIDDLGATGVQIFTNVNGRPLDQPEYEPIFARMATRGLPIWMHPARPAAFADYAGEPRSKYDLWWAFGWPYETSVAMGRLVFSGLFDRHPGLVIITHHLGAMIPFCAGRIGGGRDQLGARSATTPRTPLPSAGCGAGRSTTSGCSTATPRCSARGTPWRAASPSSAPTTCCSAPTSRSTPSRGRASCATPSWPWSGCGRAR